MAKPVKVAVIPPKFGGTLTEDAYKFLKKFESVAVSNHWDDDTKALQFRNYLTGTAELWYNNWYESQKALVAAGAPLVIKWSQQSTALQTAFRNVAHTEVAEEKLLARKQKLGESAEDYVYSMLDLISDFDPTMNEASKVRRIIKGLRPVYLEKINPMTITKVEDVLNAIRKVAETQYLINAHGDTNSIEAKVMSTVLDGFSELFTKQSELLNTMIKSNQDQDKKRKFIPDNRNFSSQRQNNYKSFSPQTYIQCHTCGRLGHVSKNCYKNAFCNSCQRYGHTVNRCFSGNANRRNSKPGWNNSNPPTNRPRFQNNQSASVPPINQNTS